MKRVTVSKSIFQAGGFSRYFFILFLAVVVITGSGFNVMHSTSQNAQVPSVPFKGEFILSLGSGSASGMGTATQVGRFTMVEQNNEEGFPVITGTATITAANGDQIFADHIGVVQFIGGNMAQVDAEFIITGGTGRFSGATGSFESHGLADLTTGTLQAGFEGSLNKN